MSDSSAENLGPPLLRVRGEELELTPLSGARAEPASRGHAAPTARPRPRLLATEDPPALGGEPLWGHVLGLALIALGAGAGTASDVLWMKIAGWTGAFWAGATGRQFIVLVLMMTGVSFLPCRPVLFLITSGLFGFAGYSINALVEGRPAQWLHDAVGPAAPNSILVFASLGAAYLSHLGDRAGALNLRSVCGFLLVALAALGTVGGWYDWQRLASFVGHGPAQALAQWGDECTWAAVLVLTATGMAASQSKTVHFLNALVLAALAYRCVRSGCVEWRSFPELARGGRVPTIDSHTYSNVEAWRWVVAAELACLAAVLSRLALGMGGLTLAFSLVWMVTAMSLYHAVGRITLAGVLIESGNLAPSTVGQPVTNLGLPLGPGSGPATASRPPISPPAQGGPPPRDFSGEERRFLTRTIVREATPLVWTGLTAILAGAIGVSGLRLLVDRASVRALLMALLWIGLVAGLWSLSRVWPREPDQSWQKWLAQWRYSRYHEFAVWLAFLGSAAIAGSWTLLRVNDPESCLLTPIVSSFLGTAASLGAASIMIRWGGFPPLPTWVYIVLVAGQSLLAWILLLHLNQAARRGGLVRPAGSA